MVLILKITLALFLLYLTRRGMTVQLSKLINKWGKSASPADKQRNFIRMWSLMFLPGTIIHEVSHFLAAALTGARTGKIEIFPQLPRKTLEGEIDKNVKTQRLGSVETQSLNPIRGFIVGAAPLIVGAGLMIWLAADFKVDIFIAVLNPSTSLGMTGARLGMTERMLPLLKLYLFFTIANSLFPSWADVKQTLPLIAIGIILGGILWTAGIQVKIGPDSPIWGIAKSLDSALWISAGLNIALWAVLKIARRLASGLGAGSLLSVI